MSRHLDVMTMRHEKQQELQCAQPANPLSAHGEPSNPSKMAAHFSSASSGLKRLKLLHRPYRSACEHIHKDDYVPAGEFFKFHIADSHWIDWNNSTRGNRGITTNPEYLLNLYGEICGDKTRDLRQELINHVSLNSNYYSKKIVVSLIMSGIDIIDWLEKMSKKSTPLDEIGIYIMSNMLDIHTTVYQRNRLWSTLELKGATETSLVANSDLLLVWVEPGRYCILREKKRDLIKPAQLTGHVTIDPVTKHLVYTPWNLSESEVLSSVDAMDQKRIKREAIESSETEKEVQTIELGRIVNYDQLRELFVDRSPLQSDTETDSEPDQPGQSAELRHGEDEPVLTGATADILQPEQIDTPEYTTETPVEPENWKKQTSECIERAELHGATSVISKEALEELQQELEISEDESENVLNSSSGSSKTLKGATGTLNRTLEDAIWKESTSEFLIVDDSILNMPDCTLSIKSLSEREIEIELDPKPKPKPKPKAMEQSKISEVITDTDSTKTVSTDQIEAPDKSVEQESDKPELATEDQTPVQKPKLKIGTGRPKRRTRSKAKSSSKSDTPRYSMRIKPTPRRLSSGGRALRSLRAINYQETYDYRTGRSREKPKNVAVLPAALTAPSAARQAAQAAIKDPSLLGATPAQRIPVLILHNNAAEDSDNTIVYDDVDVESEEPTPQPDQTQMTDDQEVQPSVEKTDKASKNTKKPKVKGSLRVKRYVIR